MRIGVLGTGMVGHAIGSRLVEVGHDVVMGSRTAGNEKAAAWAASHPERAAAGTFADAAAHGELLVNATGGTVSLDVLGACAEEDLEGKVLVDVSNPMASHGPLRLDPVMDDSNAEQLQRAHPALRVVKSLNTMNCDVMVRPDTVPGEHDVFMAGDDAAAKGDVRALLESFGWPPGSIRDVGGLEAARGLEMYLPFWISLRMTLGHNAFNIRVVT
ncbi:MAG TPA: NAD(P)-binding domain-containing protein [Actinomycetes bacterium]|nr:NAD(P)-binding domain-containing protein [Actinomycetes bacterium]